MKIRSVVNAGLGFALLLGGGNMALTWYFGRQVAEINEEVAQIRAMARDSSDLLASAQDYVLHPGPRPLRQWRAVQIALQQRLEPLARGRTSRMDAPADSKRKNLIQEVLGVVQALPGTFDTLVAQREQVDAELAAALTETLADHLTFETRRISEGVFSIAEDLAVDRDRLLENQRMAQWTFSGALMLFALTNVLYVRRRILQPLGRLEDTVALVQGGDMQARNNLTEINELGDLARGFDTMTSALEHRGQRLLAAQRESSALTDAVNMHSIVSVADRRGRITAVNDAFCAISGYSRDELIGQDHRIVNSGEQSPEFWLDFWHTISSGNPWRGEICNRAKDGQLYWVDSLIAPFMGDEGVDKFVSIRTDITASKAAQISLIDMTSRMTMAVEGANDGLWDWTDLAGTAQWWSASYYTLIGYSAEELPASTASVNTLLHPDDAGPWHAALQTALAGHGDYDVEARLRTRLQGYRWFRARAKVQRNAQGLPVRLAGSLQDVHDRKLAQFAAELATEAATAASRSKGEFLANMSHEIRTPMNAILGMLKLLHHTDLTARQLDYTAKSESAARALLRLINDILDFSKVEAGKMVLDPQPFRLDQLLRDLAVILSANMVAHGTEVLFDMPPDLPDVLVGDAPRLQQVLTNLGGNAVKFTAQGQVVVALRVLEARASSVLLQFAVKDSGIGIAPENQSRIFSGFSQAEASTTRKFGGTGLGLAISQRFVALMGGTLALHSALGEGSTFSFVLELPTVTEVPPALAASLRQVRPARRVLVIDDNPVAREIMVAAVQSWGWSVEAADSGESALALVEAQARVNNFPFDVIYVDWQMSGIDGWETVKRMRQISARCGGKIPRWVMVTAAARDNLTHRTQQEQDWLHGFLVKPVTPAMLLEAATDDSATQHGLRAGPRARASLRRLQDMRILVVEDNLINQQVAEELLTMEGALVSLAANGQLGVDAVAAARPQFDVVLMDLQMPVLDGMAATRLIRGHLGLADLPIVAMTANAMASDREECLAAGMTEHVGKPFDLSQLVNLLLQLTGREVGPRSVADVPLQGLPGGRIDAATAIARMSGSTSLYLRSAQQFARDLPALAADWGQIVDTDVPLAAMKMHTLKGTAAVLGDGTLSALASRLEVLCRTANRAELLQEVPVLDAAAQDTLAALQLVMTSLQGAPVPATADRPDASGAADAQAIAAEVRQSLALLKPLLAQNDLDALELFAQMRPRLNSLPDTLVEPLEMALQSLELEAALQACLAIEAALNAPA